MNSGRGPEFDYTLYEIFYYIRSSVGKFMMPARGGNARTSVFETKRLSKRFTTCQILPNTGQFQNVAQYLFACPFEPWAAPKAASKLQLEDHPEP